MRSAPCPSIDVWLDQVRVRVAKLDPGIVSVLDMYLAEARHGRRYIDADLKGLAGGAQILEVGAGALLLSCQLVKEGFEVTALEPVGEGFSHFHKIQEIVMEQARDDGCLPRILLQAAETFDVQSRFDYAFSINVMEHVRDVGEVLSRVGASLKPDAVYRFTCPNYWFPYEPHFDMPTLFSKALTKRFFARQIGGKAGMPDPWGAWNSLNWINVPLIRREVRKSPALHAVFNRSFLVMTLERVATDRQFAARRSVFLRVVIGQLVRLKLHHLFALVPASLQPIIDCELVRNSTGAEAT